MNPVQPSSTNTLLPKVIPLLPVRRACYRRPCARASLFCSNMPNTSSPRAVSTAWRGRRGAARAHVELGAESADQVREHGGRSRGRQAHGDQRAIGRATVCRVDRDSLARRRRTQTVRRSHESGRDAAIIGAFVGAFVCAFVGTVGSRGRRFVERLEPDQSRRRARRRLPDRVKRSIALGFAK